MSANVPWAQYSERDEATAKADQPPTLGIAPPVFGGFFVWCSDMLKEIWRDVFGYEGLYAVSNHGRVKAYAKTIYRGWHNSTVYNMEERILKFDVSKDGYLSVVLYKGKKPKKKRVNILVLETFVGPRPVGMQGCHFPDRSPTNNRVDNLMWATPAVNNSHKAVQGTEQVGEKHPNSKFTNEQVAEILQMEGTLLSIADQYGVHKSTIWKIKKGVTWSKVLQN